MQIFSWRQQIPQETHSLAPKSNNAAPKVETRKRFIEDEEDMESIRIVKPTKPSA